MLRTRLAARLHQTVSPDIELDALEQACTAAELVHAASLCHDDVIDGALVRRGLPALHRSTSPSGAVLMGDLLLCEAMETILDTQGGRYVRAFVGKIREVCEAEAEQELVLRGRRVDVQTCLRISRSKTGPLFAFVGGVCGGDDVSLSQALEESGYLVGTVYQLADDLLDVLGDEGDASKTLGLDSLRQKFTVAGISAGVAEEHICRLLGRALDTLSPWPRARAALSDYINGDLHPLFGEHEFFGLPAGAANAAEERDWPPA